MHHKPSRALLAALGCAAGLLATGIVAFLWPLARSHDAASLAAFQTLSAHPALAGLANWLANSVDPVPYALSGFALAAIALMRGRLRLAVAVPLTMLGASATTELLKPLVGGVRHSDWLGPAQQIAGASWPSGHATAAMMVGLCAVLVAPAVLRPLVALLGTVLAVGVSYSILMLGWHFPSDVLGGFLVAGSWVSVSLALLWWSERRWPVTREVAAREALGMPALLVPSALGAVGILACFAVVIERGLVTPSHLAAHASLIIGAVAIAMLAAVMASAVVRALYGFSDADPGPTAAHRRRWPPAPG